MRNLILLKSFFLILNVGSKIILGKIKFYLKYFYLNL